MRLLLANWKEISERLTVVVNRAASESEDIARDVLINKAALELSAKGVETAELSEQAFRMNLKQVDLALSQLEQSSDNAKEALSALDEWNAIIDTDERFFSYSEINADISFATRDKLLEALADEQEQQRIKKHLARPLFERFRWTKADYMACAACALLGLSIEVLNVAWRPGSAIDPEGDIRKWFDKSFHHHADNNPIDYQGPGLGGGLHRVRSPGHDLAQFLEAVQQCADGEFRGTDWSYGKPYDVISKVNQFGNAYPSMDWTAAFINVTVHLLADFFSSYSLPLPFSSSVYQNASREMRTFVHELYKGGFNFRHVSLGGLQVLLSYMAIEAWLWIQHGTHQRKSDTVCLKRYEMRLAVMGILSSGNLAGAVICRNPFQLNPPLWIAALSSGIGMMRMRCAAESELPIQLRNIEELAQEWEQLSTKSVHSEEYN